MPRSSLVIFAACVAAATLTLAGPLPAQPPSHEEGVRFFDTGPLRIREQFLLGQGFLALSENVLNFGSSADVGLHLGVTWTS